jgi:hypothetical protein
MNPRDFAHDEPTTARLPIWNEFAYAVFPPRAKSPWVEIYDVAHGVGGGEPEKVFITDCDSDDWEIIPRPEPITSIPTDPGEGFYMVEVKRVEDVVVKASGIRDALTQALDLARESKLHTTTRTAAVIDHVDDHDSLTPYMRLVEDLQGRKM